MRQMLLALATLGLVVAGTDAQEAPPAAPAAAEDADNPHVWKPRTTSVAVFKNGLGFFLREGKVGLRDGWCVTENVPPAAFGTLAVYSHRPSEIVDTIGAGPGEIVDFDGRDAPKDAAAKRVRLEACRQLRLSLTYAADGTKKTATGKLVSVGADFVVLETHESNFAVPLAAVTRMQILDLAVRAHVAAESGAPPTETTLGMAYLRKGITWIPEYTLKVVDDTTAELALRGTLVNDAEDLVHCDVNFVVGVPHFTHTDYLAPVAAAQAIRTIGSAVAPQQIQTQIMNRAAIARNDMFGNHGAGGAPADDARLADAGALQGVLGSLPQLSGPAATDFTVYTKKNLTVRRGEMAIVTLFVRKVKFTHAYRWVAGGDLQHFLVLRNGTDTAWTTGPCLAVSAGQPLSEDLLRYTPKAAPCEIAVTAAVNIARDKTESEVDRKLKAHSPADHYYLDLVTLQGELTLRNFEPTPAAIAVETSVPGKPISASDDGALSSDPSKLKLTDREGEIRWRLDLKPGETKRLTYRYERYVPSN